MLLRPFNTLFESFGETAAKQIVASVIIGVLVGVEIGWEKATSIPQFVLYVGGMSIVGAVGGVILASVDNLRRRLRISGAGEYVLGAFTALLVVALAVLFCVLVVFLFH